MSVRQRARAFLGRPIVAALVQAGLVLLALVAGWWVAGQVWPEMATLDRAPDAGWVALAAGIYSGALGLAVLGWRWLLAGVGVRRPWLQDAWFYTISLAARRLPGGVWGAVGRVYLYRQAGAPTGAVTIATVAEHGLIVVAALALAPVALALLPLRASGGAWLALGVAVAVAIVFAQPRAWVWVLGLLARRGLLSGDVVHQPGRWRWAGVGGVYALVWIAGGLALWALVRAFGASEAEPLLVVAAWVIARGAALPLTILPAGLGLSDLALALLLGYTLPPQIAAASALSMRGLVTIGEAGWAVVLLTTQQAVHMMYPAARGAGVDEAR